MVTVRLVPVLLGGCALALVSKGAEVLSGAEQVWIAPAHAAAAAEAPATPAPPPASTAAVAPVSPAAVEAESNSRSEADVLRSLSKRREALDQRERELSIREQTMAAAERRIEERVSELKAIEGRINALLGQREAAQDEQLASLVKMYESMKPGDAARIFEKLDHTVLLPVAAKMKPAKLGSVMALMDAVKAQDLTVMLAKRLDINKAQIDGLAQAAKSAAEPEGPTVPPAEPTPVPLPSPAPVAPAPAQPAAALQPDVLPEMPPPPAPAPLPAQAAPAAPATAQPQG